MRKTDILIIGGGPAGIVAAVTAKNNYPLKRIMLAREKNKGVIPCGIPYIFNRLSSVDKDILPDTPLEKNKITLLIDTAVSIDIDNKIVKFKNDKVKYDKLILATGSKPVMLPIPGIDKKGVWQVKKDVNYLKRLRTAVLHSKNIVIIGGGFIGIELADELSNIKGLRISVIQKATHCTTNFDDEFATEIEEGLKKKGVKIYTNCIVNKILGRDKVDSVKLSNGRVIKADIVILSIGARPNIDLIENTMIKTGDYGGIWVDEYMRTNIRDIFACGDCAETRDFFTGRNIPIMLASTAVTEARVAASNLYHLTDLRENRGTLGIFSTMINGRVYGGVGLTENRAKKEGFNIIISKSECYNHHPSALENSGKIRVKLIFSKISKRLLGAEISGPESISEMINILGLAIQRGITVYDFNTLQISTHPLLTASPTVYPLITAAQSALSKLK
ncbi:FAD-dependent oxidoreductase [Candidatus Micrarchaeota archaeon]|nr:FAD-dependent oxidoreductase [Candidatus Micrarchaeota archaeon]